MMDEANQVRQQRSDAASQQANREAAGQRRNWDAVNAAVHEFIPAAQRKGLPMKGVFRKRWEIEISLGKLVIEPNGRWEFFEKRDYEYRRDVYMSSSRPGVCEKIHGLDVADSIRSRMIDLLSR